MTSGHISKYFIIEETPEGFLIGEENKWLSPGIYWHPMTNSVVIQRVVGASPKILKTKPPTELAQPLALVHDISCGVSFSAGPVVSSSITESLTVGRLIDLIKAMKDIQ